MTTDIEQLVKNASARWQAFFNAGDAAGCASCYEEDSVVVATPLGTFKGRTEIEGLWRKLVADGFSDVRYIDPQITKVDDDSAILKSAWAMNKARGIITKELWVRQPDGSAKLREDDFEVQG